jgi:hypothetical protein
MFESPVVKGIAAAVVLLPVLWFGWNNLGNLSGGTLAKGDKYYYELTEGVYLAIKASSAEEFEATSGWVEPLLKEIEEGTDPDDNLGKLLNQCATDLFPKVVSGKFKEKEKNLAPVAKALEEAKAML